MSTDRDGPEPVTSPDGEVLGYNCPDCGTMVKTEAKATDHCADGTCADGGTAAEPPADDETSELNPYRVSASGIDADMKQCQSVNWEIDDPNGKVPKQPGNPRAYAKSNDATTWGTFEDALETAEGRDLGVGFPLAQASPFVAIDIDIPNGDDWVPDVSRLGGAVVERSPSGNLRVYLRDVDVPEWWSNVGEDGANTPEVGIYDDSGYVTVTGDVLDGHAPPIDETSQPAFTTWLKEAWRAFNDEDDETPPWENGGDGPVSPSQPGGSSGELSPSGGENDVDIGIYDIISRSEHPEGERVSHPFHGSDSGTNFMVDDDGETFVCWRASCTATNGKATVGHAGYLLGMDVGVLDCGEWLEHDIDDETWREIYDEARDRGYDIPEQDHRKGDSRTAGVSATGTADDPDIDRDSLTPMSVMAIAGLSEDEDLSKLNDPQKAYWVYQLIEQSDDHHLLAAQPDGEILRYDEGLWSNDGEQYLRELGANALGSEYTRKVFRELKEQVRAYAPVQRDGMGAPSGTVATENGLLDLETRDLRNMNPEDHALFRLGTGYDADADCSQFKDFLGEVVRPEDIDALQEYAGYCLHHWGQPHKRAILLLGPQDSGKSTFLHIIKAILGGSENVSSENLNSLVNTRWGAANLYGSVANVANELETTELQSTNLFKTITGAGDYLTAERKGEDPFQFVPKAKHLFATNRVPPANGADDAFFSRWLFATFPQSIPTSEQVRDLDEQLLENERAGILNWMLDGYDRLRDQDGFTGDSMVGAKRERWEMYGNSVERFKHNALEVTGDAGDVVVKEIAHQFYARYCREKAGTEVETQAKLTRELKKDKNITDGRRKVRPNGKQWTAYVGVKFHPAAIDTLGFDPGAALDDLRAADGDGDDDREDEDGRTGSLGNYGDE